MAVVAFIGLGQMGRPMSLNILRGGHSVQVYDVDRQSVEALAAAGASACPTPAEAARFAELAARHMKLVKTGRTHMMDATPITFGQELSGFIDLLNTDALLLVFAAVLILGIMLSLIATFFAVNKYLRMGVDKLYYI